MTTKALSSRKFEAAADTLGILLAGYLEREHESARFAWDRTSGVLCVWPLLPLGVEEPSSEG